MELCQPQLSLDAQSLNARLTRLEDQIRSGAFVAAAQPAPQQSQQQEDYDDDRPPMPGDDDAPPSEEEPAPRPQEKDDAPMGFWADLISAVRKELPPTFGGFLQNLPNAPVKGRVEGNRLEIRCANKFTQDMMDKPEILEVFTRKGSAMLGRPVTAFAVDMSAKPAGNPRLEELLNFGKAHADVVTIKNNN